ncbi:MAG TPA: hypothetical protein VFM06_07510 [Candidatus Limnocylindria bacterium]|nr:hypothetical protein [Candidatus Limnocylindria bacterium]
MSLLASRLNPTVSYGATGTALAWRDNRLSAGETQAVWLARP